MKKLLLPSGVFLSLFLLTANIFAQAKIQPEKVPAKVWKGHENSVTSIAVSTSGKWVASSSLDGTVKVWNAESGSVINTIRSHTGDVYSVSISKDERRIASAGLDGRVVISDLANGETLKVFSDFNGWCQAVVFSPDGERIAVSTTDGNVSVWEIESGKRLQTFESRSGQMSLAWSPDGKYLASGFINISIWDTTTGKVFKTLKGHDYYVYSLAFSPDGKLLASASLDTTIGIWDAGSGEIIRKIEPAGFSRTWKDKTIVDSIKVPVTAAAFSPDGKHLATGGADKLVRLWNVADGKSLAGIQGHEMSITDLKFLPDGKHLISSSLDRTIRLWNLKNEKESNP